MKTIKEMKVHIKAFNEYYKARMNVKQQLQEAYDTLYNYRGKRVKIENHQTIKLLSKEFDEVLVKELKSIERKVNKSLDVEKVRLFGEVIDFVWSHPEKAEKLIIQKNNYDVEFDENDFRNGFIFNFSGELGELVNMICDFSPSKQIDKIDFTTIDKSIEITNTMSPYQVKQIIINRFVTERNKDYFTVNA